MTAKLSEIKVYLVPNCSEMPSLFSIAYHYNTFGVLLYYKKGGQLIMLRFIFVSTCSGGEGVHELFIES